MRIQTVVQHDPRRAHLIPTLLAALPPGSRVVEDPGAGDPQRNPWRCYIAALAAIDPDATHLLIVQDDCEPCRDFPAALDLVVERHPDVPLVLFTPGLGSHCRRILSACADGKRYVQLDVTNSFLPCVAVVWPRDLAASILNHEACKPAPKARTADDGNLSMWAKAELVTVLATVPSLVEHPDREPSLVGKLAMNGRNPSRIAACWVGRDMTPLELDW